MKKILSLALILSTFLYSQDYYSLELDNTGVSQLIIFQNSISSLEPGDEIGIFDASGITNSGDCLSETDELLVGTGVWSGNQLELVSIGSVDNCAFGGFQLPGFVDGNSVVIKIYRASEEAEYSATATYSAGTGTFGDLFMAVSDLTLDDGNYVGPYYNIDINSTGSNQLIIFQNSISSLEPGDEIGIFDASGITNSGDCLSETDELLVGTGVWLEGQLEIVSIGSIDNCAFGGFQLPGYQEGNSVLVKVYRSSEEAEYTANVTYSAGTGTFGDLFMAISEIDLYDESAGCTDSTACNYDSSATADDGSCEYILDCAGNCGGSAVEDCNGDCQGTAYLDLCNVCSDGNSGHEANSDIDCNGDCFGTAILDDCDICSNGNSGHEANSDIDCNGDCFGGVVVDECGVCGGDGIADGACDCAGNVEDCAGECNGSAIPLNCCGDGNDPWTDSCSDCGYAIDFENGICDCDGSLLDCAGECGTGLVEDECGECGGDGIPNGECDCLGNIEDCIGECGGNALVDVCGICEGLETDLDNCSVSYSEQIQPIFTANCIGCHSYTGTAYNQVFLGSYSELFNTNQWFNDDIVVPYSSEESFLIEKLYSNPSVGAQMPFYADPLDQATIDLITLWIDQGAIGDDGDGGESCPPGYILDCNGDCQGDNLLGDGNCDNGEEGEANFNCAQFTFDNQDCPLGQLYFDSNGIENNTIGVYMDCAYPITNYTFSVSGLVGMELSGGMLDDPSFMLDPGVSDNIINWISITNALPENYGLLFYIEFDEATSDICFSESLITTSAGLEYEAELGDCILFDSLSNDDTLIPIDFSLGQAYPNPFNPIVNIPFSLSKLSQVKIDIYDINGNKIDELANQIYSSGTHSIRWIANGFASGTYLIIAEFDGEIQEQKIVLMK